MKIYNNKKYSDGSKARFLKPGTFKIISKIQIYKLPIRILKTIYYCENEIKKKKIINNNYWP